MSSGRKLAALLFEWVEHFGSTEAGALCTFEATSVVETRGNPVSGSRGCFWFNKSCWLTGVGSSGVCIGLLMELTCAWSSGAGAADFDHFLIIIIEVVEGALHLFFRHVRVVRFTRSVGFLERFWIFKNRFSTAIVTFTVPLLIPPLTSWVFFVIFWKFSDPCWFLKRVFRFGLRRLPCWVGWLSAGVGVEVWGSGWHGDEHSVVVVIVEEPVVVIVAGHAMTGFAFLKNEEMRGWELSWGGDSLRLLARGKFTSGRDSVKNSAVFGLIFKEIQPEGCLSWCFSLRIRLWNDLFSWADSSKSGERWFSKRCSMVSILSDSGQRLGCRGKGFPRSVEGIIEGRGIPSVPREIIISMFMFVINTYGMVRNRSEPTELALTSATNMREHD